MLMTYISKWINGKIDCHQAGSESLAKFGKIKEAHTTSVHRSRWTQQNKKFFVGA